MTTRTAVGLYAGLGLSGRFELIYRHPDGSSGWRRSFHNGVTYAGVNHLLNLGFRGGFQATQWFVGLIGQAGYSTLSNLDTYATHAGWSDYPYWLTGSPGNLKRPQWNPGPVQGGLMSSLTPSVGSVTLTGQVRGAFLCNVGPTGPGSSLSVLYATGAMAAAQDVASGGTLSLTYGLRLRQR